MIQRSSNEIYDALVVGAGPAGTSAATILAQHGRRVALIERESFPRYKVGESMIPHCWYALDRLGVVDKLDSSDFVVPKHSVQFASTDGVISAPFYFHEHSDHPSSRTWQVDRARFDQFLLDHARKAGAEVFEQTAAKELLREGSTVAGARVVSPTGEREIRARVTIDASGRDVFSQSRNRWRVSDDELKKVAIWTYFKGARRDGGLDEGATTIAYLEDKGWFWYIPLPDDMVSVGVVAEPGYLYRDPEVRELSHIFCREIGLQPWIKEHLAGSEPQKVYRTTRDFTYRSRHCATDGLVLVGDAFSFLDPVFSSGVFLALTGGVMAGDAVHGALEANDVSAERFEEYGEKLCEGIEAMRRLVFAFYDVTFSFGAFLKQHPGRRKEITDVLIGDLFRDFDPLYEEVARFAKIPGRLPHGTPLAKA